MKIKIKSANIRLRLFQEIWRQFQLFRNAGNEIKLKRSNIFAPVRPTVDNRPEYLNLTVDPLVHLS